MKTFITLVMLSISTMYAQGITNTLGGNTADDKFIISNQSSDVGLVVTGEGDVGLKTTNPAYDLDLIKQDGEAYFRIRSDNASSSLIIDKFSVAHMAQIVYQHNHESKFFTGLLGNNNYRISTDRFSLNGLEVQEDGIVNINNLNVYDQITMNGTGINISSVTSDLTGRAFFGHASNNDINALNYGGYFKADGRKGIGVYGLATDNYYETNYGGYFESGGGNGIGVYGAGTYDASGQNYGGYFICDGPDGTGLYAEATNDYGKSVHAVHQGKWGYAVYGDATNSELGSESIGGYFRSSAYNGVAVYGVASGDIGCGVKGDGNRGVQGYGSNIGVYGNGSNYDFYAEGGGENYGAASSIRWKENIVEIDNPLEKLSQIRGVYFNWDEEHGGKQDVGCIAEEIGKVLPEIVVYEDNGVDAEGMDYSKLAPLLIEAIKALERRVAELEATK